MTTVSDTSGSTLFGRAFWRATLDRAIKSGVQALLVFWAGVDGVMNWADIDPPKAFGIAIAAMLLSVATSIGSAGVGPVNSPSTI